MTRIEYATSLFARTAAWVRRDHEERKLTRKHSRQITVDMVNILLTMSRLPGAAKLRDLQPPDTCIHYVQKMLISLATAGYVTKTRATYTLTDKGKLFINTILK